MSGQSEGRKTDKLVFVEVDGVKSSVSPSLYSDSIVNDVVTACERKFGLRYYIVKFKGEFIERDEVIPDTTSQDPIYLISKMSKWINLSWLCITMCLW